MFKMESCKWCEKKVVPNKYINYCGRLCYSRHYKFKCSKVEHENKLYTTCKICGKLFKRKNRGIKLFCSPSCKKSKIPKPQLLCKYCKQLFVLRRSDKLFCSRNCKILYRIEFNSTFRYGQNMNGKKCKVCGFDTTLDVHHIDKNKNNNNEDNLMILCPTHHFMIHRGYAKIVKGKYILTNKKTQTLNTIEPRNSY